MSIRRGHAAVISLLAAACSSPAPGPTDAVRCGSEQTTPDLLAEGWVPWGALHWDTPSGETVATATATFHVGELSSRAGCDLAEGTVAGIAIWTEPRTTWAPTPPTYQLGALGGTFEGRGHHFVAEWDAGPSVREQMTLTISAASAPPLGHRLWVRLTGNALCGTSDHRPFTSAPQEEDGALAACAEWTRVAQVDRVPYGRTLTERFDELNLGWSAFVPANTNRLPCIDLTGLAYTFDPRGGGWAPSALSVRTDAGEFAATASAGRFEVDLSDSPVMLANYGPFSSPPLEITADDDGTNVYAFGWLWARMRACADPPDDAPDVAWNTCIPVCGNRECGDDGCGGSCGRCGPGLSCAPAEGRCVDASCGNGRLEPGEGCDNGIPAGPGSCPTDCADDGDPCTVDRLSGSVDDCTATCVYDVITECSSGDSCCPQGCTADRDGDCR